MKALEGKKIEEDTLETIDEIGCFQKEHLGKDTMFLKSPLQAKCLN